jgi:cyclopropane-fatty-acyl-phospholipid synthase
LPEQAGREAQEEPMNTDRITRRIMMQLLTRVVGGTVEIVEPGGTTRFGDHRTETGMRAIDARVEVHDPRLYGRVMRGATIGLGESYADGWWDADDLAGFLRILLRTTSRTHTARDHFHRLASPVLDPIARMRPPDQARDRRNVRAHYDVGNELFERVLDDTMMYSCAVFDTPDASLETASLAKVDRLARLLELSPDDHLLEIGTGWGGFALHAARRYGCRVTTTTISREQYEYARRRVHEAGLDHLVTVRPDDYRNIQETFSKVIAIEMIEAVDWRDYDAFFAQCHHLLSENGVLAMQAIVVPDSGFDRAKRHTDFIKGVIFPGSCIPSVEALTKSAQEQAGMDLVHLDHLGVHYAETLRHWRANLVEHRRELAQYGFDERFIRLWEFYFAYCEAGFDERYTSVTQLLYAPKGWRPRSLTADANAGASAPPKRHLAMARHA